MGANMRLLSGFGCFVCGSLAVLLCAAPANPDRHVNAALARIDAIAAVAHSDAAALAGPELRAALADAVFDPGMTSGFRDDYRQSIASGHKAATGNSYHGGSLRGGYGHGLAADIVSVKGETRSERCSSSEFMWKWIDAHGKEYGIGRPYLDKDPPHIAPIDGKEYADKRGGNAKLAEKANAATSGDAKAAKPLQALQGRAEPKPL